METFNNYVESKSDPLGRTSIVIIQGSPRTKKSCSGGNSKTGLMVKKIISLLPDDIKIDYFDLCVCEDEPKIQACKGCISTANRYQCHYPCTCYSKGDKKNPDYMHDKDVYKKMEKADGFVVFSPVNWYALTTQIKAFFDRLVCINLTLSADEIKKILGENYKNPVYTAKLEDNEKYNYLIKNHYENKVAAFFVHGDEGANDYKNRKIPLSLEDYYEEEQNFSVKDAVMPLVHQCRYSGIFVPNEFIKCFTYGKDNKYFENNKNFDGPNEDFFVKNGIELIKNMVEKIKKMKTK